MAWQLGLKARLLLSTAHLCSGEEAKERREAEIDYANAHQGSDDRDACSRPPTPQPLEPVICAHGHRHLTVSSSHLSFACQLFSSLLFCCKQDQHKQSFPLPRLMRLLFHSCSSRTHLSLSLGVPLYVHEKGRRTRGRSLRVCEA